MPITLNHKLVVDEEAKSSIQGAIADSVGAAVDATIRSLKDNSDGLSDVINNIADQAVNSIASSATARIREKTGRVKPLLKLVGKIAAGSATVWLALVIRKKLQEHIGADAMRFLDAAAVTALLGAVSYLAKDSLAKFSVDWDQIRGPLEAILTLPGKIFNSEQKIDYDVVDSCASDDDAYLSGTESEGKVVVESGFRPLTDDIELTKTIAAAIVGIISSGMLDKNRKNKRGSLFQRMLKAIPVIFATKSALDFSVNLLIRFMEKTIVTFCEWSGNDGCLEALTLFGAPTQLIEWNRQINRIHDIITTGDRAPNDSELRLVERISMDYTEMVSRPEYREVARRDAQLVKHFASTLMSVKNALAAYPGSSGKRNHHTNIYLFGPAGSGKSALAQGIAEFMAFTVYTRKKAAEDGISLRWEGGRVAFDNEADRDAFVEIVRNAPLEVTTGGVLTMNYSSPRLDAWRPGHHLAMLIDDAFCMKDTEDGEHVGKFILILNQMAFCPEMPDLPRKGTFMDMDCSVMTSNMANIKHLKSLQNLGAMERRIENCFLVTPKPWARGAPTGETRRYWKYRLDPKCGRPDPWIMILCSPMTGQPVLKDRFEAASVAVRMGSATPEQRKMVDHMKGYDEELPSSDPECPYKLVLHTRQQMYDYTQEKMFLNWEETAKMDKINKDAMDGVRQRFINQINEDHGDIVVEAVSPSDIDSAPPVPRPGLDTYATTELTRMRQTLRHFVNSFGHFENTRTNTPTLPKVPVRDTNGGFVGNSEVTLRAQRVWARIVHDHLRSPPDPGVVVVDGLMDATPLLEAHSLMLAIVACRHLGMGEYWHSTFASDVVTSGEFVRSRWGYTQVEECQKSYTTKCSYMMEAAEEATHTTVNKVRVAFQDFHAVVKRMWEETGIVEVLKMATVALSGLAGIMGMYGGVKLLIDKIFPKAVTPEAYPLPMRTKQHHKRNAVARAKAARKVTSKPSERADITLHASKLEPPLSPASEEVPRDLEGLSRDSFKANKVVSNTILFTTVDKEGRSYVLGHGLGVKDNVALIAVHMLKAGYNDDDVIYASWKHHNVKMTVSAFKSQVWDPNVLGAGPQLRDYCLWSTPKGPRFVDIVSKFMPKGSMSKNFTHHRLNAHSVCLRQVASGLAPMLSTRPVTKYSEKNLAFVGGDQITEFLIGSHIVTKGPTTKGDSGSPIWVSLPRGIGIVGLHTGKREDTEISIESTVSLEDLQELLSAGHEVSNITLECVPKADLSGYKAPLFSAETFGDLDTIRQLTVLEQVARESQSATVLGEFLEQKEAVMHSLGELSDPRVHPDWRIGEPVAMTTKSNRMTATSKQKMSELHGAIGTKQPSLVPSNMTYGACIEKVLRGCATMDSPKTFAHPKVALQADMHMIHEFRNMYGKMGVLTFEEAVSGWVGGVKILQPMARNTSAGMGEAHVGNRDKTNWMGRGGEIDFTSRAFLRKKKEVLDILADIEAGNHPITVIKPSPKDEMLPASKEGKCRVIYATDDWFVIIVRMYYGWYIYHSMGDRIFDNHSAVGLNSARDGLSFLSSLTRDIGRVVDKGFFSLDVSKYDASQSYEVVRANFHVADQCYDDKTPEELRVRSWIADMSAAPHIWVGRWVYRRWGGWISGHPLTTIFNNMSWRRALLMTVPFIMDHPEGEPLVVNTPYHPLIWCDEVVKHFNNISFGDDNVIYWPDATCGGEPVTTATFKRALEEHVGWTITNADKTDPYVRPDPSSSWKDISFLKRTFINHNPDDYLHSSPPHVYMALDLESIQKSVNYTTDTTDIAEMSQVVDTALCQISYHGKRTWDQLAPGLIKASVEVLGYYPRNFDFLTALYAERH